MRRMAPALVLLAAALMVTPAAADTIKLRGGKTIQGQFIGGDSKSVRILLDSGQVSEVPLDQASAVEFSPRKPPAPPPPPPAAAAPRAAAPAPAPAAAPPDRPAVWPLIEEITQPHLRPPAGEDAGVVDVRLVWSRVIENRCTADIEPDQRER